MDLAYSYIENVNQNVKVFQIEIFSKSIVCHYNLAHTSLYSQGQTTVSNILTALWPFLDLAFCHMVIIKYKVFQTKFILKTYHSYFVCYTIKHLNSRALAVLRTALVIKSASLVNLIMTICRVHNQGH